MHSAGSPEKMASRIVLRARVGLLRPPRGAKKKIRHGSAVEISSQKIHKRSFVLRRKSESAELIDKNLSKNMIEGCRTIFFSHQQYDRDGFNWHFHPIGSARSSGEPAELDNRSENSKSASRREVFCPPRVPTLTIE